MMVSLSDKLQPSHTAIVVVDMQNDFFRVEPDDSGRPVNRMYNGEALRDALPRLLDGARQAGVLLVFVRMINDREYLSPPVAERLDRIGMLGVGCQSGTSGADYWEGSRPDATRRRDLEVIKHRYSAFHGTDLALLLRANGIQTVAYTGVATSGCVESTAREGLFNDFYGVMVQDCVADGDRESHDASLRKYERSFGEVVPSQELLGIWSPSLVDVGRSRR
jgi:ureidoacrylate peracid hydrolase